MLLCQVEAFTAVGVLPDNVMAICSRTSPLPAAIKESPVPNIAWLIQSLIFEMRHYRKPQSLSRRMNKSHKRMYWKNPKPLLSPKRQRNLLKLLTISKIISSHTCRTSVSWDSHRKTIVDNRIGGGVYGVSISNPVYDRIYKSVIGLESVRIGSYSMLLSRKWICGELPLQGPTVPTLVWHTDGSAPSKIKEVIVYCWDKDTNWIPSRCDLSSGNPRIGEYSIPVRLCWVINSIIYCIKIT